MDSTITAAIITTSGTVIVAVIGWLATRHRRPIGQSAPMPITDDGVKKKQAFLVRSKPDGATFDRLVKIHGYKGKAIYVYDLSTGTLTQEADSHTPDIDERIHRYRSIGREIRHVEIPYRNAGDWLKHARKEAERLTLAVPDQH